MPKWDYVKMLHRLNMVNAQTPDSVKMGLSNTKRLYELVGQPLKNTPVIHVGGTNGKGSVCWKISTVLRNSGLRTGLFVSPHISSYRERIQVNNQIIDESTMTEILPELFALCEQHKIHASAFELTTVLALLAFEKAACDAVVMEVGCGGRLDATNVLSKSALSIVTSIQYDHQRILGETLPEIAAEKAGIAKPGGTILIGFGDNEIYNRGKRALANASVDARTHESPQVVQVLHEVARKAGASSVLHMRDVLPLQDRRYALGVTKDIDMLSTDISLAALRLLSSESQIKNTAGVASASHSVEYAKKMAELHTRLQGADFSTLHQMRPPCRFQLVRKGDVDVILDVAHNAQAMSSLCEKVLAHASCDAPGGHVHVVVGMSRDKNMRECMAELLKMVGKDRFASHIHCIGGAHKRCMPAAALRKLVREVAGQPEFEKTSAEDDEVKEQEDASSLEPEEHIRRSLRKAIECAASSKNTAGSLQNGKRPTVIVTGSIFVMAVIRQELGLPDPQDPAGCH